MHQVLDGQRDALFHLCGRGARHRGGDVEHRHQDLRIFFARNDRDREDSERQRRNDEQRRQLGVEKCLRQASGKPQFAGSWLHPVLASMRLPARSRSPGSSTSFSPAQMPERTSTRSPCAAPSVT